MYFALKPKRFIGRHRFQPGENVYNVDNLIRERSKSFLSFLSLIITRGTQSKSTAGWARQWHTHGAEDQTHEVSSCEGIKFMKTW